MSNPQTSIPSTAPRGGLAVGLGSRRAGTAILAPRRGVAAP